MRRATADEQAFLRDLITGNLRRERSTAWSSRRSPGRMPSPSRRASGRHARRHRGRGGRPRRPRWRAALADVGLVVGRPLRPMLAASAKTAEEAVDAIGGGELIVDGKLDGIRVQVHRRPAP